MCAGQDSAKPCTFQIDVAAFQFFATNGYFKFNESEVDADGNRVEVLRINWPICIVCRAAITQQQLPVTFRLGSYLSDKCRKYPSYQKIVFNCGCKAPTNVYTLGDEFKLGWNKGFEAPAKAISTGDATTAASSFAYRDPLDD